MWVLVVPAGPESPQGQGGKTRDAGWLAERARVPYQSPGDVGVKDQRPRLVHVAPGWAVPAEKGLSSISLSRRGSKEEV